MASTDYKMQLKATLIKCEELEAKLAEKCQLIEQFYSASEAVCDEYSTLKTRYEVETEATSRVIRQASLWYKENKALKRKSTILIQKVSKIQGVVINDIDIEETIEPNNYSPEDIIQKLTDDIVGLRKDLERSENETKDALEDIAIWRNAFEKEKFERLEADRKMHESRHTIKQISRMSLIATQQYDHLMTKYEHAKEHTERLSNDYEELNFRQTLGQTEDIYTTLVETVEDNQFHQEINALKRKHKTELQNVEMKISEITELRFSQIWEEKINQLQQCLVEAERDLQLKESALIEAQEKIHKLELERDSSPIYSTIPAPPPPPPPPQPQPQPPINPIKSLMGLIASNKKGRETSEEDKVRKECVQQELMSEIMNKIKKGDILLKPVKPISTQSDEKSAFVEMNNILKTFRHRQPSIQSPETENELFKVFKMRKQRSESVPFDIECKINNTPKLPNITIDQRYYSTSFL